MLSVSAHTQRGFTLIELAIVLVIIGLIVGGVLVGRDLINAAGVRATIAQIEQYNQAANTFRGKYGFLPGDISGTVAAQFGFVARGSSPGQGDGNGILEGPIPYVANGVGSVEVFGEAPMFWVDLSTARLIQGGFSAASPINPPVSVTLTTSPTMDQWFPAAKLGGGNYIYVYSAGTWWCCTFWATSGANYYGISAVSKIDGASGGGNEGFFNTSTPGLTVQQAAAMDAKMDDGLPQSGNVLAQYIAGGGARQQSFVGTAGTAATAGSATTCYDNGGTGGAPQQYSMGQNNGTGVNCALSFRFQ